MQSHAHYTHEWRGFELFGGLPRIALGDQKVHPQVHSPLIKCTQETSSDLRVWHTKSVRAWDTGNKFTERLGSHVFNLATRAQMEREKMVQGCKTIHN